MAIVLTTGAATLLVVWRVGHNAQGRVVKAGSDVIEDLRGYARVAATIIEDTESGRDYDPDQEQDQALFLRLRRDDLLDDTLVAQLERGASLGQATTHDLRTKRMVLYALLLGNDPANRSAFVRATSPVRLANKGIVALFDETLTRVTGPLFAFDESFDVVVTPTAAWALNQTNFERLFKESPAVLARTSEWVESLSAKVPIAEASKPALADRLRNNSVLRRKVQSLLNKPYLPSLTPEMIRAKVAAHGLDPHVLLPNGKLEFRKETERDLLNLLNEDLFVGDFTGGRYAAARKSVRPPSRSAATGPGS